MTEKELAEIALGEWPESIHGQILSELASDDPTCWTYERTDNIPSIFVEYWSDLTIDQRLIIYIVTASLNRQTSGGWDE